jgi:hypothetical protein
MKRSLHPIRLFGALALVAVAPWAVAGPAEECRQMAAEDAVSAEDLEDYIAECIAMMENRYPDDAGEYVPDAEEGSTPTEAPPEE